MYGTAAKRHRLGMVVALIGLVLMAIGMTIVLAQGSARAEGEGTVAAPAVTTTATLKAAHVGATNPGFQAEDDDRCPEGSWGWHFVMPTSGTDFVTLTATFQNDGAVTATAFYSAAGQVKHAYVFTTGPDTLLGATAQVEGPGTVFNLSHVCVGTTTTTTTTSSSTTTTTSSSTTTTGSTTTTTAPSTSTSEVAPTTVVPATSVADEGLERGPKVAVIASADEGVLARTGVDVGWPLILGGLLLVAGVFLVHAARPEEG